MPGTGVALLVEEGAAAEKGALPADLKQWLLNADPALRWQVERDLLHEPEAVWRATRARVAERMPRTGQQPRRRRCRPTACCSSRRPGRTP